MKPEDELDDLINDWDINFEKDQDLEDRIQARIRTQRIVEESPKQTKTLLPFIISRPLYAGIAAAALIVFGITLSQIWHTSTQPTQNQYIVLYRSTIDPLFKLSHANEQNPQESLTPSTPNASLDSTLAWLKQELKLKGPQKDRLINVHRSYEESLHSLYSELTNLDSGYNNIDQSRKVDDVVDFLALYELLQKQKKIKAESHQVTEDLIQKITDILTPNQQKQFNNLIRNDSPPPSREVSPKTNV